MDDESQAVIILTADQAERHGVQLATTMPGYSGAGYVTGFDADGDAMTWTVEVAQTGWYDLHLRMAAWDGPKRNRLMVDGLAYGDVDCPAGREWREVSLGTLHLELGPHRLALSKFWGGIAVDRLTLRSAAAPSRPSPAFTLNNPQASDSCRELMAYLAQIYGRGILSGQHTSAAAGPEITDIQRLTGKKPALRGFDLLSYSLATEPDALSPSGRQEIEENRGSIEAAIRWANVEGGIVTICWHWFSPLAGRDKSFYTKDSDFDLIRGLDPHTAEHRALIADIDAIAKALGQLAAAKIPVLWRPLHEADGGWFWWGAKGPEAYLQLYRLLYQRLTGDHHLSNLIWVWNAPNPAWYPGDAYVDVAGDDIYVAPGNYGPLKLAFDRTRALVGDRKPVALTENGAIPDPDRLRAADACWLWYMPWWGGGATFGASNSEDHVCAVYRHPDVVTLEKLPHWQTWGPHARP